MADATYLPKVYRKQGGDELVVASGGTLTVESGGAVAIAAADQLSLGGAVAQLELYQDTIINAAALNGLAAANVDLVDAPAAGYAAWPTRVHLFLDHGGTDFVQTAAGDHLAIKYKGSNEIAELGSEAQCTALIEAAADHLLVVPITGAFVPEAAKALSLDNNGANEYATGDGVLYVRTYYVLLPTTAF